MDSASNSWRWFNEYFNCRSICYMWHRNLQEARRTALGLRLKICYAETMRGFVRTSSGPAQLILLVAGLTLPAITASANDNQRPLKPDLHLNVNGALTLAQIAPGRPVVLAVVKAHWCRTCQEQLRELDRYLPQFQAHGAFMAALSSEGKAVAQGLRNYLRLKFGITEAPMEELKKLGFVSPQKRLLPGFILLDKCGKVAWTLKGRSPGALDTHHILERIAVLSKQLPVCGPIS